MESTSGIGDIWEAKHRHQGPELDDDSEYGLYRHVPAHLLVSNGTETRLEDLI